MDNSAWLTQLKRGLLELFVLNLLEHENLHGYELVKRVSGLEGMSVTEGTIYPLLSRMKQEGLLKTTYVESTTGPMRKTYQLTPTGRQCRREMNRIWKQVSAAVQQTAGRTSEKEGI
jgi:PadR family transcriptional regulator, regulatory protein PadR